MKYQSVSLSICTAKCKQNQYLCVHGQKIAQQAFRNKTDSVGPSARFSNYVVCDILLHLKPKPANTLEHCTIESRFATILMILPTLNCVPICTYSLLHLLRIETSIYLIILIPAIALTLLNIEAPFQYEGQDRLMVLALGEPTIQLKREK